VLLLVPDEVVAPDFDDDDEVPDLDDVELDPEDAFDEVPDDVPDEVPDDVFCSE
jgi:hypothetical protein